MSPPFFSFRNDDVGTEELEDRIILNRFPKCSFIRKERLGRISISDDALYVGRRQYRAENENAAVLAREEVEFGTPDVRDLLAEESRRVFAQYTEWCDRYEATGRSSMLMESVEDSR